MDRAQTRFQAARWAEDTPVDVRALAREGNLPILDWLRSPALEIVVEWARAESSATLNALRLEYLEGQDEE